MAASLTTDRIRTAARHLDQESRRVQADLNAHTVLFKLVAEDMERENDSESVAKLREGLLEVIRCSQRLEQQSSVLENVSETFVASSEPTDFKKLQEDSTRQMNAASPLDPTTSVLYEQFNKAVWHVHHAGEPEPGQEQEEMVMITSQGQLLNRHCPISGRPVIDLKFPVRSIECHHIYDQEAVMDYIRRAGRKRCKCASVGCTKDLKKDNLVCDATLKLEIEEARQRERVSQKEIYTEVVSLSPRSPKF